MPQQKYLDDDGDEYEPGNIDLAKQPKVPNPDGGTSTVFSVGINLDGVETLLPSVTPDGRFLATDDEVVDEYRKTGLHLGKFSSVEKAEKYADQLHKEYEAGKYNNNTYLDDNGDEITEPTEPVDDRSILGKAWDAISVTPEPIQKAVNWGAEKLFPTFINGGKDTENRGPSIPYLAESGIIPGSAAIRGFYRGAMEGVGTLLNPLDVGTTILGLKGVGTGLNAVGKVANTIGMGLQGLRGLEQLTEGDYAGAAGNIGFAGLGTAAHLHGRMRKLEPLPEPEIIPESVTLPDRKQGTPAYNTQQFGLTKNDYPLPYPLNIVPDRLKPPSTNATVFNALLPEKFKEGGTTSAVDKTDAISNPARVLKPLSKDEGKSIDVDEIKFSKSNDEPRPKSELEQALAIRRQFGKDTEGADRAVAEFYNNKKIQEPLDFDPNTTKIKQINEIKNSTLAKKKYDELDTQYKQAYQEWLHGSKISDDDLENIGYLRDTALDRYQQLSGERIGQESNQEQTFVGKSGKLTELGPIDKTTNLRPIRNETPQLSERGLQIAEQELRASYGTDVDAADDAVRELRLAFQSIDPIERTGLRTIGSGKSLGALRNPKLQGAIDNWNNSQDTPGFTRMGDDNKIVIPETGMTELDVQDYIAVQHNKERIAKMPKGGNFSEKFLKTFPEYKGRFKQITGFNEGAIGVETTDGRNLSVGREDITGIALPTGRDYKTAGMGSSKTVMNPERFDRDGNFLPESLRDEYNKSIDIPTSALKLIGPETNPEILNGIKDRLSKLDTIPEWSRTNDEASTLISSGAGKTLKALNAEPAGFKDIAVGQKYTDTDGLEWNINKVDPITDPDNNVYLTRTDENGNIRKKIISRADVLSDQPKSSNDRLPPLLKILPDDIQKAVSGDGGVKIGADIEALSDVLATTLYGADLGKVVTKELVQNSLDAIRAMGLHGRIDIFFNEGKYDKITGITADPSIAVHDNGPGLTRQELQTIFTDLGASGKRNDQTAIGGFGIAKAAPLLSGKYVSVSSVARDPNGQLMEHYFEGSRKDLLAGVHIESKPAKRGAVTGMVIETFFEKDKADLYQGEKFIRNLAKNSSIPGKITANHITSYGPATPEVYGGQDIFSAKDVTHINDPIANIDFVIPDDASYKGSSGVNYEILNNGMWQASGRYGWDELVGIPNRILININSKVPEGHADYPWTANRESLRGAVQKIVNKYIDDVIVNPAKGKRFNELVQAYNSMVDNGMVPPNVYKNVRPFITYDVGKKFTTFEADAFRNNPQLRAVANVTHSVAERILEKFGNQVQTDRIEKIGFLFDDEPGKSSSTLGLHVPNPQSGKSAILFNPMAAMTHANTPDEVSIDIFGTIVHEISHADGGGHDANHEQRMADILRSVGAKRAYEYQLEIEAAYRDPNNPTDFHADLQGLLQTYTTIRGRPATFADPLYGTGIKSENKGRKGKDSLSGNDTSTPERAIAKLNLAIKDAKPIRELQEASYTIERAERMKKSNRVRLKGEAGFFKRMKALEGEYEKVEYSPGASLNQADTDAIFDYIQNSSLLDWQKKRTGLAILKILDGKAVPQRNELKLLAAAFGQDFADNIIEMHGGLGAINAASKSALRKVAVESLSFTKSLKSSVDLSAPLRQGFPLIHRPEYWNAVGDMFGYMASQKKYDIAHDLLKTRRLAAYGETVGLKLTDIGKNLEHREEMYMSVIADKYVPGVKQSNRAYTGFLNQLRANTFDSLVNDAVKAGLDPFNDTHLGKSIAKFVNNATGRGSLGSIGEKNAVELNAMFFSPRFVSSRLQTFNPNYYAKLHPYARKEALKSLGAWMSMGVTVLGVAKLAGATIEQNPTSPDFMKARWDNIRIDPWAGLQQTVVAASKMISGYSTSSTNGRTTKMGSTYTSASRMSTALDFGRSKLSPIAGFIASLASNETDIGGAKMSFKFPTRDAALSENIETFQKNAYVQLVEPMYIQDLYKLYKDGPSTEIDAAIAIWDLFGGSSQIYDSGPQKSGLRPLRPLSSQGLQPIQ